MGDEIIDEHKRKFCHIDKTERLSLFSISLMYFEDSSASAPAKHEVFY